MGVRVSLVLGSVLATLLLMGSAFAATCGVEQVSPQEYTRFLNAVYSPQGLLTLNSFGSAQKPVTTTISRDSTAVIDEAQGIYHPIEFNTNGKAIDVERSDLFLKNMVLRGPFLVVGVLSDTLRVSKPDPMGYGVGKGLQQRFEGRMEYATWSEALHAVTEIDLFRQAFLGSVSAKHRVNNVLLTDDFTVTTTCASNGCDQEMYSLFTKYLNVGASAQMLVEFGGGYVWKHLMPSQIKSPLYNRAVKLKAKITGVKTAKTAALDAITEASDDAKKLLKEGDGVGGIWSKDFSPSRIKSLDVADKQKLAIWASYVDTVGDDALKGLSVLKDCLGGDSCDTATLDRLAKELPELSEAFEKAAGLPPEATKIVYNVKGKGDEFVEKVSDFTEFVKTYAANPRDVKVEAYTLSQIDEAIKAYTTAIQNTKYLAKDLSKDTPITTTLSGTVNQKVGGYFGGGAKGAAAEYTISPITYYFLKRMAVAPHENPFAATGSFHVSASIIGPQVFGKGFQIPDSWKISVIAPPQDVSFTDSFVDILIGNGSDPGDAFKSLITLSGAGIVQKVFEQVFGREIPAGGLLMTKEQSRMYSMGPAIATMGVAASACPACVFSGEGGKFIATTGATPLLTSIVEDTNTATNGSTLILFGHHVNFRFSDGGDLDLARAIREKKDCYDTCPLVSNSLSRSLFGKNPARAMFVMSYVQSLSAVAGPVGLGVAGGATILLMTSCGDCVDTTGGYYLHLRAHPTAESEQTFELTANDALSSFLDSFGKLAGSVSEQLGAEVNAFKKKVEAERIRNSGVYAQIHLNGLINGELHITKLIEAWSKPTEMIQTSINDKGSIAGSSDDGRKVLLDKGTGVYSIGDQPIITNPDLVRLGYIDNTVPGLVIPAWVIVSEFTANPAFAATKDGYSVLDQAFLRCFASHIPGGTPTSDFFQSIMSRIILVNTTAGTVNFSADHVVAVAPDWSGFVSRLEVGSDYNVTISAATVEVNTEGNTINVSSKVEDRSFGALVSIIFENGAIYVKDGKVLVNIRRLARFPGNYVQNIDLTPNADKNAMNAHFTPAPNAPDDVKEQMDRVNKMIEEMGGINSILAQNGAVALYRDENGTLWLRIYDRNALKNLTVDQAYEILRSVLAGDGKYSRFEVLDGSLQIYREGDHAVLSYIDRASGQRVTGRINSYDVDANRFVLHTEVGDHTVSLAEQDGVVVALLDGVVYGPVVIPGAVKQERVLDMYQDPNTGALVVKTDQGTHTIQVKVDSNGTPQLLLDGVLKGLVQAMQGPKGFVSYNPDTGEWSLVAGLLTPLAEAFKNGIKISLDASGNAIATPAPWTFKPNPYMSSQGGGLSLPLLSASEIAALVVVLAVVFAIIR